MKKAFLVLAMITLFPLSVCAHPPSSVAVTYDPAGKRVTAAIMHSVNDPARHYVFMAELIVNGKIVKEQKFEQQKDNSQQTAVFEGVVLNSGDQAGVAAYCNISGKRSGLVKVE